VPDHLSTLRLPTDLLGVTVAQFAVRKTSTARRNGMKDAVDKILAAIKREGPLGAPADPALANELLLSVSRQLGSLRSTARITMAAAHRKDWENEVLAAVLEPFLARSDDAYSEWLRPDPNGDVLRVVRSINLDAAHDNHEWRRGEGLVVKVWETGQRKAVDHLKTHPWFKTRPGCENETYLCAPIGKPGGPEGVLAVGSDAGFDVRAGDLGLLHVYGELLALAMSRPAKDR
jgi:GAF domain-containing protein